MTQKPKLKIADLLRMPSTDDVQIDFDEIMAKVVEESKIDKPVKELFQSDTTESEF